MYTLVATMLHHNYRVSLSILTPRLGSHRTRTYMLKNVTSAQIGIGIYMTVITDSAKTAPMSKASYTLQQATNSAVTVSESATTLTEQI